MSSKQGLLNSVHNRYPKYLPDGSTVRRNRKSNSGVATLKSVAVFVAIAEVLIIITSCARI